MITVFTPTYNRAYIISCLYESLCTQTNRGFEWLVVDDGSTDDTEFLLNSFIQDKKINIHYIKQENGGKHRAINRGVKEAKGELFFIVDSDDQLVNNTIERIYFHYNQIKTDFSFAGVSGVRAYFSGERIGGEVDFDYLDCTLLELRYTYGIHGDLAEAYRTSILREFPFPEIEGEKFCPEVLVWCKIARKYKLRFFNEKIYLCQYLEDGLTAKILKIRQQSPIASMLAYLEIYRSRVPFIRKFKAAVSFWRFYFYSNRYLLKSVFSVGLLGSILMPIGFLFYKLDK